MGKYKLENLKELVKPFNKRIDFQKAYRNEYDYAWRHGWLDELYENIPSKKTIWTIEMIHELALKYKTRTEFRENEQKAYEYASKKLKCLDFVCSHMVNGSFKYFEKDCLIEALKYESRSEFSKKSPNLYRIAWKYGWLDNICKHMIPKINQLEFPRIIYSYEFPDNSVYVGLTKDFKIREATRNKRSWDSVTEHSIKTNLVPIIKYLTDFIPACEAQIKEQEFIDKYKSEGWKILNKRKAGGLGG